MKVFITILALLFSGQVIGQHGQGVSDSAYQNLFCIAMGCMQDANPSTFLRTGIYVVLTVVDQTTGESKELCTTQERIESAINRDSGNSLIDYDNRMLKLKSEKALETVRYYSYDSQEYKDCTTGLNAQTLKQEYLDDNVSFKNRYSHDCQDYIAQLLFESGILSSNKGVTSSLWILDERYIQMTINHWTKP